MSISDSKWLTLSEAAQLLGVHPTTLRRWADQGSVPVSVTPGGHRRFLEADLATNATRRQMLVGVRDNTAQVWGDYALVETRQRLFNRPEPAWLVAFDEQERTEKRELGRRLLGLIMQHISAPADDGALLVEARSIAVRYAQNCLRAGLSAAEGLQATTFFRDALTEVALQMPQVARLEGEAQLRLLRKLNQVFNVVQVTLIEYYEQHAPAS
ncbi:MAG: helix-turn-helix domain-containing protein [Chloroflexota bacterium]|jgi:excisionase family DNA binding protein